MADTLAKLTGHRSTAEHVTRLLEHPTGPMPALAETRLRELLALHHTHPEAFRSLVRIEIEIGPHGGRRFVAVFQRHRTPINAHLLMHPRSPRARVTDACRQAVFDDITEFRANVTATHCPITGYSLATGFEIDHTPPNTFHAIFCEFLNENLSGHELDARRFDAYKLVQHPTRDVEIFASQAVADSFAELHDRRAVLRAVHPFANRVVLPLLQRIDTGAADRADE